MGVILCAAVLINRSTIMPYPAWLRRFNPNLNPYYSTSTCQAKNGKTLWRFMAQKQQTGWD
jgi:hypothetical protein